MKIWSFISSLDPKANTRFTLYFFISSRIKKLQKIEGEVPKSEYLRLCNLKLTIFTYFDALIAKMIVKIDD